ncbi:MAG: ATP-binding protein [Treponema sp.]|nr:ATP-binding protein [Treponema sp.]
MNYQYLLRQVYEQPEPQLAESVFINNPYEKDDESCKKNHIDKNYDLSVLNTSIPALEIVEMVQNALLNDRENAGNSQGIRLLFYGLSGAGKTKLAHYIAERLGMEVLSKNASDIFGMYVGESEKNIANAFEEARLQKKLLLFDEVDSFFRDRSLASQSWEITQVNEFLTQMEKFEGLVICTTNLRNLMDKAMQRRFHVKVEFKALKDEGVKALLNSYFSQFVFSDDDVRMISRFGSAVPGDFENLFSRLRFMNQKKISGTYITDELCKMQEEKEFGKRTVGFMK